MQQKSYSILVLHGCHVVFLVAVLRSPVLRSMSWAFFGIYLALCVATLLVSVFGRLPDAANWLSVVIVYQLVVAFLFPRGAPVFNLFIAIVSVVLGTADARRIDLFGLVFLAAGIVGGARFLLITGYRPDVYEGIQFFFAGVTGMCLASHHCARESCCRLLSSFVYPWRAWRFYRW